MDPFDKQMERAQYQYDMQDDTEEDDVPDVFSYEDEAKADDERRGIK